MHQYGNETGIGLFYPQPGAVIRGVAKVYGLAYAGEGWLEQDRGVGRVEVRIGRWETTARLYVKNRYWVRTFDSTELPDGPVDITATAYDRQGKLLGSVTGRWLVDNAGAAVGRKRFAAADGSAGGDGSLASPWDLATALDRAEPGDVLCVRGGVYTQNITIYRSGTEGAPIVIANYRGEAVELRGAGIDIADGVEHVTLMGFDQSGLRFGDSGLELGDWVRNIEVWDCTFCDNTHPYEEIPTNERLSFGVGFNALTVRGRENGVKTMTCPQGYNRQCVTVSHCAALRNDCHGFDFSSIDHGRFQFLEAGWNPNNKKKDIFQYKHADGFTIKNSEYEGWGFPSEDCAFLFCYSHHNGQDGFDIRTPHVVLFGCVSHDETQSGAPFGGSGIKTWEYDYKFYSCLSFRNNITDRTGYAMEVGNNSYVSNCLFYDTYERAVQRPDNDKRVKRVFSSNNLFVDCNEGFDLPVVSSHSLRYGACKASTLRGTVESDPMFIDGERGNFFLRPGSPALTGGDMGGYRLLVDGVELTGLDALGRPRASRREIGPYTRYPDAVGEGEGK